jgi:hypothetical protein
VEAVIVFPLLLWALAAIHVFWDGYRSSMASIKATYTVSDLLSRQTGTLGQARLDQMAALLDTLAGGGRAGGAGRDGPSALRVSVARLRIDEQITVEGADDDVDTTLVLDLSETSGAIGRVTAIAEIEAHIPPLAPGDSVLVVETRIPWRPLLQVGLDERDLVNVAVTRPRADPQICWERCGP